MLERVKEMVWRRKEEVGGQSMVERGQRTAVTSPAYKGAIGGIFWPTLLSQSYPNSWVAVKALSIFRRR